VNRIRELDIFASDGDLDVLCTTESWASDENICDAMLSLNGKFNVYRCDRKNGKCGGGVFILVRKSIPSLAVRVHAKFSTCEIVAIDIQTSTPVRLICVYRPPNYDVSETKLLLKCISSLFDVNLSCVVVGDFNVPHINWQNLSSRGDVVHASVLNFAIDSGLSQLVTSPTRLNNILDLIFCQDDLLILEVDVCNPFSTSDHASVSFILDCSFVDPQFIPKRDFVKGDYERANQMLSQVDWVTSFHLCTNAEDCYSIFCEILQIVIADCVPLRLSRPCSKDYPDYVLRAQAEKRRCWRRRHLPGGQAAYLQSAYLCSKAVLRFQRAIELSVANSNNCQNFFRFVKSQTKMKQNVAPLRDSNNVLCTSDLLKANILQDQFCSVFTVDDGCMPNFPNLTNASLDYVLFTPETVWSTLCDLKEKLSCTPDNLPSLFLKRVSICIAAPLAHIYSLSLISGIVPKVWRSAIVVPIFKKGPADCAENYRPVSLTSVVCRVMEKIISLSMISFLRANNLISTEQHGFLSKRSTVTQLLETVFDWCSAINNRKFVDSVFIDFTKAFDSCSHPKLLLKLSKYGITGSLLLWIQNYLSGRTQCVQVGSCRSRVCPVVSGVPQGSVLGPLLFLLYINDLSLAISGVKCKLYADDAKFYSAFDRLEDVSAMDEALIDLQKWSNDWQLPIAVSKCNVLHVGYTNPRNFYALNLRLLEPVDVIRDLGVLLSSNLSFSEHCSAIALKASRVANMILRAFRGRLPFTLIRAFCCYVRPILEYASPVWNPYLVKDVKIVEKVQKSFTRRVFANCGLPKQSYEERLIFFAIDSLQTRRAKADLLLLYKMSKGTVDLNLSSFFPNNLSRRTRVRSNGMSLPHPFRPKLDVVNHSFAFRTRRLWNSLPVDCVQANSVSIFVSHIDKYFASHPILLME
jgi:hypothetical protein